MNLIQRIRFSPWYFKLSLLKNRQFRINRKGALRVHESLGLKNQLVFDIGASSGTRTELMLQLGCQVVALEPDPVGFEVLNCRFGTHPRAVLLRQGAGSKSERGTLYRCENSSLSTFSATDRDDCLGDRRFSGADRNYFATDEVEITTLDDLISEFGEPYFCAITTIGYEQHILAGLSHPIPIVTYSVNLPYQIEAAISCCDKMASLGDYRCGLIFSNLWNGFHNNQWWEQEAFKDQLKGLWETRPGNSRYVEVYCVEKSLFDQLPLAPSR